MRTVVILISLLIGAFAHANTGNEINEPSSSSFKGFQFSDPAKKSLKIVIQKTVNTSCTDMYLKTNVFDSQNLFRRIFVDAQTMRNSEVGCVFSEKKERVIKSDVITINCVPQKFEDGSEVCVGIDVDIIVPSSMEIIRVD